MTKKHLLLAFRTLIALAGIAFIVASVNFGDRVELPAGTPLPDGRTVTQEIKLKVVSGRYDPTDPTGTLVVALDDGRGTATMSIAIRDIRQQADGSGPRFVPGLVSMLRQASATGLIVGLLATAVLYPIITFRWWLLMRARQIPVTWANAFRLTMVGHFFNFCMPGTTGGDVVKAFYAARGSDRRAETVVTVVVDRVCGLLGLLILAGGAGLFMLNNDVTRRLTLSVWMIALALAATAGVYYSPSLRRRLGVEWLLAKKPAQRLLAPIDQAVFAYRHHKTTVAAGVLAGVVVHSTLVFCTATAGYALGMQTPIGLLMVVIPVTFLVGAIPIAPPQGIGVMEVFAVVMLPPPLAYPNQVVGMFIMIRLYQMFYAVLGSVYLLKGDIRLHRPQDAKTGP